jgi:hypothetical protein
MISRPSLPPFLPDQTSNLRMPVESPSWMRQELRRVSGLHHRGAFDSTDYLNAKTKIISDAHIEISNPCLQKPSRLVSKKKLDAYCDRLHLASSRRRLRYDPDPLCESLVNTVRRRWRPTGALVKREHPEEKQVVEESKSPCVKCNRRRASLSASPTSAAPSRATKSTTVASSIRLDQLARAKPHLWWTATPTKTLYRSQRPSSTQLSSVRNQQEQLGSTASPWPIFRRDQEENGLSAASCSVVKITHPVLLYRAQKQYAERMEVHYKSTYLDKMKLPPLDYIPVENERY